VGTEKADGRVGRPGRRTDVLIVGGYLCVALALLSGLWLDPNGTFLRDNGQDQTFFEWVLAHAARTVPRLENPLFTRLMNAPDGVNLMANTSILALAVPLIPVTLLFGPAVSFLVLLVGALAGTAAAWYLLLSRQVVNRWPAAALGGAFAGFAPAMISQDTGHPNVAGQFVVPVIVLAVLSLGEPGNPVRRGLGLAGLVVFQSFLNEEVLFLTALALAVFLLAYAVPHRSQAVRYVRDAAPALGVAVLVAGAVLAYPLWLQFAGPQSYHGLPEFVRGYSTDLAAFPAYARRSLAGRAEAVEHLAQGPTEENTFFGWPLIILVAAAAVYLYRSRAARALAVTGVVFAVLSLGSQVNRGGQPTGVPGPWRLLVPLPLFDSVVPTRLALVLTPVIAVLLALLVDRLAAEAPVQPPERLLWTAALVAALLPVVPTPLPAVPRPPVPHFFTSGTWREYVPVDGTIVPVPMGWYPYADAMRWATAADLRFRIVGGYFLGPDPARPDGPAIYGPGGSATERMLAAAADSATPPPVEPSQRDEVLGELRRWRATTLVLPVATGNADVLRATVDHVAGTGRRVDDVWLWDLR
jgi:hypothetical protein